MQAGISTANAARPMHDVMNHAHTVKGKRISFIPFVLKSSVVVMKLRAPNSWPTQKKAIELAQSTSPSPCPGPAASPTALNGAYWVHPARVGPSPTKNDEISITNPTKVNQKDIMLKRGNGMSSAPT